MERYRSGVFAPPHRARALKCGKELPIPRRLLSAFVNVFALIAFLFSPAGALAQKPAASPDYDVSNYPHGVSAAYTARDFHFTDGETLPELRLHYVTLGQPHRDAAGKVDNAVLILHGTGGSAAQFLTPNFAGVLFGPGQLLDASRYYIVLPDSIGHGLSSKPSDGMHMRFPRYDYDDMVRAQHLLLTDGLHIDHARLILGTSMGCMHAFVWGEMYPSYPDALMPLACQPVEIAGRNRMTRKMVIENIERDPGFQGGDYSAEPLEGLRTAEEIVLLMGSSPLQMQEREPTRDSAEQYLDTTLERAVTHLDADDMIYQFDASRNYNPYLKLGTIQAQVLQINSADDFINPPELHIADKDVHLIPHGRFVLLPITEQTRGHGTHTLPAIWQSYLQELLAASAPQH